MRSTLISCLAITLVLGPAATRRTTVHSAHAPAPVLDFTAERLNPTDGLVYLSWRIQPKDATTLKGSCRESFTIQRSPDGQKWLEVGTVSDWARNGHTDASFHFRDPYAGATYYRIGRLTDSTGLRFCDARFVPAPTAFTAR